MKSEKAWLLIFLSLAVLLNVVACKDNEDNGVTEINSQGEEQKIENKISTDWNKQTFNIIQKQLENYHANQMEEEKKNPVDKNAIGCDTDEIAQKESKDKSMIEPSQNYYWDAEIMMRHKLWKESQKKQPQEHSL